MADAAVTAKGIPRDVDKPAAVDLLRQMLLIRNFEDKAAEMYAKGKIGGFLHLYNGEEAVAVGAISVLRKEDLVVTHYRDHGHALAKGSDPGRCMAELFGKATGLCKGKGGSMHFCDASVGILGGYAIVAGHLPLATGLAFAFQYQGKDNVVLCFFGDGATNGGDFHEALNLSSLWKLPVVFICENNLYGMGTALRKASALLDIHKKAAAYDMPGERVDGMDVFAVREATARAVAAARAGEGPTLLEALCYRFRGHSMADPVLYRGKEEEHVWRARDPITTLRARLEAEGVLSTEEYEALEREVTTRIEEAVRFAEGSPEPAPEELYTDVYARP
ncbi:MAG TPA: pyruvate dehydrogenase (acetyl-transferring) E1 component subunit alpha [Candidatus Methylomirabilis sp.]|jgi:pyruvate dehydrogenase E1 component alpha subunit|nr:pyruvate dehydrogenase (acetyl-transferring) E1 component subunit alpha [Candidatus Methylomirabilis sp.]